METKLFQQKIFKAQQREALIGSALARHFDCSIRFNQSNNLGKWDYTLYNSDHGWCYRIEQTDELTPYCKNGTIFLEQYIHQPDEQVKGKFLYTRADRWVHVINPLEKVIIFDVKAIRQMIVAHESVGALKTTTPDFTEWRKKHQSNPVSGIILEVEDILLQDPKAKEFSFYDLNITSNQYKLLHWSTLATRAHTNP